MDFWLNYGTIYIDTTDRPEKTKYMNGTENMLATIYPNFLNSIDFLGICNFGTTWNGLSGGAMGPFCEGFYGPAYIAHELAHTLETEKNINTPLGYFDVDPVYYGFGADRDSDSFVEHIYYDTDRYWHSLLNQSEDFAMLVQFWVKDSKKLFEEAIRLAVLSGKSTFLSKALYAARFFQNTQNTTVPFFVYSEDTGYSRIEMPVVRDQQGRIIGIEVDGRDYAFEYDEHERVISVEQQITNNTANQAYAAIYGKYIVWQDRRNGNYDIYLYDLFTNTERRVTTNSAGQYYADISGNYIVWEDYRNGASNCDIYLYDFSKNTEWRITANTAGQYRPKIWGNYIVWDDYRNEGQDIYSYDLSTNTERPITTNAVAKNLGGIWGDYIVWHDYRNGNYDIYLYDLSTNTERQITADRTVQSCPDIWGDYIVWHDYRNGNYDIYLYDLSTNTERRIAANAAQQLRPKIWNNYIVWEDSRNGNLDIYLYVKLN